MIPITIQPKTDSGKGRSFSSHLLAYIAADALWDGGGASDIRPVWAVVASGDQELRPFLANWTRGRRAEEAGRHGDRFEILKSAGYATDVQRFPEGSIATVYLPDLFRADPGMVDPKVVRFVMLPGQGWAAAQTLADRERIVAYGRTLDRRLYELPAAIAPDDDGEGPPDPDPIDALLPHAFLFAVYLDRRTRCPLVADGRFYLQLMASFLREGAAQRPGLGTWSRKAMGVADVGIAPEGAMVVLVTQEDAEDLIARETRLFFENTKGGGSGST